MNKPFAIADNEEGSVIILSILVLVILSIVGFSASRTSTTEMQIVRNDGTYNKRFYIAESGAVQVAQMLENDTNFDNLRFYVPAFLNRGNLDKGDPDMRDTTSWVVGGANATAVASTLVPNGALEVSIMHLKVAPGSAMGMENTQLHELAVIGLLDRDGRGQHMVEIGYRKRY
jgi:hypothetical protein